MTEFAAFAKEPYQSIFHKICAAPMRRSAKVILRAGGSHEWPAGAMPPAHAELDDEQTNNGGANKQQHAATYLLGAIVAS
jgi:hypothetical protein